MTAACPACGGAVEATADPGVYRCAGRHRSWDRAEGPRPGEVPWGFTDAEWAEREPAWRAAYRPTLVALPSPTAVRATPRPEPAPEPPRLFAVPEPAPEPTAPPKRKTIPALSPSSAALLAQCPRRFEFEKVLGRRSPPGVPATLGKFIHKVLELWTALPVGERTEESARPIAARLWADSAKPVADPVEFIEADRADVVELRKDLGVLRPDVRQFKGGAWAAVVYAASIEASYGGEVAFRELDLSGTSVAGVPFRGYADRVDRHDDGLCVVDYKSGRATVKNDGSVDHGKLAEKGEQLLWYWDAISDKTDEQVMGALLAYIGAGQQVVLWVDGGGLDAAREKFARLWRALGSWEQRAVSSGEPYPADASYLCGWCPFWSECREGSAFLLDKLGWADARESKGKPVPPFRVEMLGWDRGRRERWVEFARGR